jgi:hypothetical protein
VFCQILKKLRDKTDLKLTAEGFMPLVIEQIDENIETAWGVGKLISLAHYYEENGDLMRDPEMVFIVVDNRDDPKDLNLIGIYPQLYQLDALGLYEESIRVENNKISSYISAWQTGHCSFANTWLKNIKAQGFLR